ncbi:hypothetical protein GE107_16630 [Cohnella sp. CFH 77786]|uniref:hypothetical protein n=1 Tax=Cohnella sp. CFH 77786 TaxID=2662265 RepID=UPI001C610E19|nr:hypothetical protein [Cohnella sp. CFH 77786]MBW5447681.1 hypothetical protein [Cohnella sp. CFH 77786]
MTYSFTIQPESFRAFDDEAEMIGKCKEWGLLSEKASKAKTFYYKGNGMNLPCSIVGYVDRMTSVIEFDNGQRHCIHPSYLKEMQASSYGQKTLTGAEETSDSEAPHADNAEPSTSDTSASTPPEIGNEPADPPAEKPEPEPVKAATPPKEPAKKGKTAKLQLPEDKVRMRATVKEFATVPNHFTETEDEVIVYEAVWIEDPETEVGDAWSSHSATLKKLELQIGDKIRFEGKIVAKKLTKHPVPYKINNPSKIQKES